MILYPAVDIRGGKAVRLEQGDYERETVFDEAPIDAARRWVEGGAQFLHVVDLDGARQGEPVNLSAVQQIATMLSVPVQCGGGIRNSTAAEAVLVAGADRVVVGSAALHDPDLVGALVDAHGDRVVVAVDTREGRVAVSGWLERSDADPAELVEAMVARGVRRFVYTPVEADGTLDGPDTGELGRIAEAAGDADLVYSGGIGSLEHLGELKDLGIGNLGGVIVGRALYEGRFTVSEGIATLAG